MIRAMRKGVRYRARPPASRRSPVCGLLLRAWVSAVVGASRRACDTAGDRCVRATGRIRRVPDHSPSTAGEADDRQLGGRHHHAKPLAAAEVEAEEAFGETARNANPPDRTAWTVDSGALDRAPTRISQASTDTAHPIANQ